MTDRDHLVIFLKAVREELLRVREWNSADVGICTLAKRVYRKRFVSQLDPDSDLRDSDLESDHIIQYLHNKYNIDQPSNEFWWPIAVSPCEVDEPWAEEGRQSRLAFLDRAIADLEYEIKERL